uniref:Uncharacterized protein n=1 Tax=Aegilops tauschii subsp. strangulata TaxID=200361 RepID=A0A453M3H8_AEGTS
SLKYFLLLKSCSFLFIFIVYFFASFLFVTDDFRFNEVKEQGKHAGLDIDINISLSNSGVDDKLKQVEDFQHTMHPLDVARQKYFFSDDMTPSCRIFVDHDDCGNKITEPELWRDLDMDSNAYEAQIEKLRKNIHGIQVRT